MQQASQSLNILHACSRVLTGEKAIKMLQTKKYNEQYAYTYSNSAQWSAIQILSQGRIRVGSDTLIGKKISYYYAISPACSA